MLDGGERAETVQQRARGSSGRGKRGGAVRRVSGLARARAMARAHQLDGGRVQVLQQHVLGLEVAVADAYLAQEGEDLEELLGEVTDERAREARAPVLLQQLQQIHPQGLKGQAQVAAEDKVRVELHDERACVDVLLLAGGGLASRERELIELRGAESEERRARQASEPTTQTEGGGLSSV